MKIICKTLNIEQVFYVFENGSFMAYYISNVIYIYAWMFFKNFTYEMWF
jgi:hypothetical protein